MVGRSIKEEPGMERRNRRSRSRSRSPSRGGGRDRGDRRSAGSGGGARGGGSDKMVYISNIPYDVRWMDLKDMVREKAGEVAFVEMLENNNGKSKGAAVVEFKDRETAQKCIDAMHRMEMKDRQIVVKEIRDPQAFFRKVKDDIGVDFLANRSGGGGGRAGLGPMSRGRSPPRSSAPPGSYETYGLSPSFLQSLGIDGPLCNRVFVANLPYNIQSGKLREVFSLAGKVVDMDIQLDKEGKSKGLAVVEFSHPIEAVQSISMLNNQRLHDRGLSVKMDRHEKQVESRRPGELPSGLSGIGMGLGANGAPLTNIAQLLNQVNNPPAPQPLDFGVNQMAHMNSMQNIQPAPRPIDDPFLSSRGGASSVAFSGGVSAPMQNMTPSQNAPSMMQQQPTMNPQNIPSSMASGNPFGVGAGTQAFVNQSNNGMFGGAGMGMINQQQSNFDTRSAYVGQQQMQSSMDPGKGFNPAIAVAQQQMQPANAYDRYEPPANMQRQPIARSSRVIIIRNLPSDYTWQMVRDRLRGYGDIEFADIIQPGVAKIRFKAAIEAERAMANLSGMSVEGRLISIDYGYQD